MTDEKSIQKHVDNARLFRREVTTIWRNECGGDLFWAADLTNGDRFAPGVIAIGTKGMGVWEFRSVQDIFKAMHVNLSFWTSTGRVLKE